MDITLFTEEGHEIETFYDLQSNPFKVGDVIYLTVEEMYPYELNKYKQTFADQVNTDNEDMRTHFDRKRVKLVKESKFVTFKKLKAAKLTIEYECKILK